MKVFGIVYRTMLDNKLLQDSATFPPPVQFEKSILLVAVCLVPLTDELQHERND